MLATTHVLTGAVIGRVIRKPAVAYAVGVASHLALDSMPHWGIDMTLPGSRNHFLKVAVTDGVALSGALFWIYKKYGAGSELAGALGALTLDMDKPMQEVGVQQLWPDRLHHVHISIQTGERPWRWPIDMTVAAASIAILSRSH